MNHNKINESGYNEAPKFGPSDNNPSMYMFDKKYDLKGEEFIKPISSTYSIKNKIMNQIDLDYQNLVRDILENGHKKNDRTGTGTISVFGRTIRHSMKDGFPLLTTKKMAWKTMVTELLWFLRGDTNLRFLVDRNCHIWDGDAYKNHIKDCILFDEISNSRMTRTIIGCPCSTDITSYIDTESDWGAVDYLTGEKIKYEDCDNGVIYFNQKMVKISSLKQIGVIGLRCESLYEPLDESNFIYNKEEFINKIKTDDEFAKKWGELGPVYGKQWRSWTKFETVEKWAGYPETSFIRESKSIDQIANVIHLLKTDPDSRRMIVNAYNVGELGQMVLPPCHMMFQFYTRELTFAERLNLLGNIKTEDINEDWFEKNNIPTRAISLRWDQRSNDIGLGSPMNISSYSLLLMIIAKQVNMVPEEVIGHLGDCHIYNNHVDGLKEQLTRIPYELPTVRISDRVVNDISEYTVEDFTLENYASHPKIYLPLSN